jgi:hemerythrin-like metal-binding protein
MALISWNEKYSVKVDSIDKQHKRLVDLINELHDAMMNKKAKDVLLKIIRGLVAYTSEHFGYEEKLFVENGYADSREHKKEHSEFIAKISDFQEKYEGGKLTLSMEMLSFLKDWLLNHIAGTDQKYSAFLVEKGVK